MLLAVALLGFAALGLHVAPARATPKWVLPRCFGRLNQIRTFYLDPESSKNARSYPQLSDGVIKRQQARVRPYLAHPELRARPGAGCTATNGAVNPAAQPRSQP